MLGSLQPILARRQGAIILGRSLREPLFARDQLAPALPASPLDTLTASYPGQFINAAPYFVTDRDGVLRSWSLWRGGCAPDPPTSRSPAWRGHWVVLPSVQLAIKALRMKSPDAPWITPTTRASCLLNSDAVRSGASRTDAKDGETKLDAEVVTWLRANPSLTVHPVASSAMDIESDDRNTFNPRSRIYYSAAYPSQFDAIETVSALKVLRAWPRATFGTSPRLPSHVGDVVIIGQSSDAVGDFHATPLGNMPGDMVLANAIYSISRHGIVQRAPTILALPLTALTIVVMGFAFARFDTLRGSLVIGVFFYAFLILTSYLLFLTDYWFDFAVPLIGLYADRLISAFEEHVKLRTIKAAAVHVPASGENE
jgi:hypothetical protein